ncbi:unnamed protein product [Rotaria sp. Silwood1]|nr:unnamed protein product [Rotaria sp. Silwood1]CAF1151982.1 unnamed protein product [Rotaria sp. Silwood1]CAF3462085.1 unnamed protein product [Rotaria sp. Silwood1]CAF3557477.1 unnamed protein product [Rotaria sp. Silwood1]CAF4599075.1 unnamed protein product [Rotaria sp. Silwood1]
MATSLTNSTTRKSILIIKSPESSIRKSTSRNVHFVPDIIINDDDQITMPIQDSLTIQSTKNQIRKLSSSTMTKSMRKIKINQRT